MREARARAIGPIMLAALLAGCAAVPEAAPASLTSNERPTGTYRWDDFVSHTLVTGPHPLLEPEIVDLLSDVDGGRLQIALVRPDVPEGTRVPVIVEATPYYSAVMDAAGVKASLERGTFAFYRDFVTHGYAIAVVPVRGTANQAGCADLGGPRETADLDQAVTWLGEQAWSNGNVGMHGLSYRGSAAYQVAALGNPHLKTIVPVAGVNSLYDLMYRNGSHEFRGSGRMALSYHYGYGFETYNPANGNRDAVGTAEIIACPEVARAYAASAIATATRGDDPLGFWAERDTRPGIEANYNGSIFIVQGLQDWNIDPGHTFPWINTLETRGLTVKLLLGQWDHVYPHSESNEDIEALDVGRRMDYAETLLHWFDRWLKEDTSMAVGPRVEVQDGALQWRTEIDWPPRDAAPVRFYLTPEGVLATEPAKSNARVTVGPAPNKMGDMLMLDTSLDDPLCPMCPRFTSEPLESELRISGLPPVPLTVVPTAPFGHISAWLYALGPDGAAGVGWGSIDLHYAAGDGVRRDVEPGKPVVARLQLEPLDEVVPAGSRLLLLLHQGGYGDHTASLPTAPIEIEVGGEASYVELPAILRDGSTFFAPPQKS